MPNREISVRFNEASANSTAEPAAAASQARRQQVRPHTAAAAAASVAAPSAGAPFLDAHGNRTQPSRDQQPERQAETSNGATTMTGLRRKKRKKRRPKTAMGIEQQHQNQSAAAAAAASNSVAGGGSEPNFPTLNPRVFHALRGFLTPESLRKTKFYSDREDRMSKRRVELNEQEEQLRQRIGGFYLKLDSFIAETNAAAQWEPEDQRKKKSLLDDLDNL